MDFLQQNMLWVALAVFSGSWWLVETLRARGDTTYLSPSEATLLINRNDAVAVDLRAQADFDQGHIPNARQIPHAELEQRIAELEKLKERPLIFCCQTGRQAAGAVKMLRKKGFDKVHILRGGLYEWQKSSLPLTRSGRKNK